MTQTLANIDYSNSLSKHGAALFDLTPNIITCHNSSHWASPGVLTLLPSKYCFDVLLPAKILSYMVLVSVHGRDEMGQERLRIITEDWIEPEESEHIFFQFHIFQSYNVL